MESNTKIAGAIIVAGSLISLAYATTYRYEYTRFDRIGAPQYTIMHDRWTGKSCVASGPPLATKFADLPLC